MVTSTSSERAPGSPLLRPSLLAVLPNVPTLKEVGLESDNRMAYVGIYGPSGIPEDIVNKLNAAIKEIILEPGVRKRIEDAGFLMVASTPEQFAELIKSEFATYKKVVESAKLSLD